MPVAVQSKATIRAFKQAGFRSRDLSSAWPNVEPKLKGEIAERIPVKTGRLLRNLRGKALKSAAKATIGGARMPYAAVINFGWPGHNIYPHRFMAEGAEAAADDAVEEISATIARILKDVNLKD